jgi:hypothetical protein
MKSWKSTALGIIAGLMIMLPQIGAVLDDDSETNPDYQQILAALSLMGVGIVARDNGVTSEQAGASK